MLLVERRATRFTLRSNHQLLTRNPSKATQQGVLHPATLPFECLAHTPCCQQRHATGQQTLTCGPLACRGTMHCHHAALSILNHIFLVDATHCRHAALAAATWRHTQPPTLARERTEQPTNKGHQPPKKWQKPETNGHNRQAGQLFAPTTTARDQQECMGWTLQSSDQSVRFWQKSRNEDACKSAVFEKADVVKCAYY